MNGILFFLPFNDRLDLAYEEARLVFERRGDFISDDSVLDIAEAWTVNELDFDNEDAVFADYDALKDALFSLVFEDEG
jgi:hypothetical protein